MPALCCALLFEFMVVAPVDAAPEPEVGAAEGGMQEPFEPVPIRAPDPPPRNGTLSIDSTAFGARLIAEPLDVPDSGLAPGEVAELGPMPVHAVLAPGRWRLRVDSPGYQPWSLEVSVVAGEVTSLQAEPELIDGAWLELRAVDGASEGAKVELDGELLCTIPCREMIAPGDYQVAIRKRRKKPLEFPLTMVQADEVVLDVTLEPATSRAPALITGVAGLATLTTAVIFTARAEATRRDLARDLQDYAQYDGDDRRIDAARRDAVVAGAMYGTTAVIGALTLFYLLRQTGVASKAEKHRHNLAGAPRWQLAPNIGLGHYGLTGELRF